MIDPIPLQRPVNWQRLRSDEAERVVKERARQTDNVFFAAHAFARIEERAIVQEDVYWILETGSVEGYPIFDDGEWKVVMVRRLPGKREAGVVTLRLIPLTQVRLYLVFWLNSIHDGHLCQSWVLVLFGSCEGSPVL